MRILLVTHYYPGHGSGIELVAGRLAERLVSRGIHITWAATDVPLGVPAGIEIHPLRAWNGIETATGFAFPIPHPADLRRLSRRIRDFDVIHLHEHLYPANLAVRAMAAREGKPILITQHTSQIWPIRGLPLSLRLVRGLLAITNGTAARWALGGANRVVLISAKSLDYYQKLFDFSGIYIPNGLNTEIFHPCQDEESRRKLRTKLGWPLDRSQFLFVGRMIAKKGLPAIRACAERLPHCDFAFAGTGPIDPREWQLANIRLLGFSEPRTLADYYRAADFLLLPSLTEGFPLVVQESLACGTPAIIPADVVAACPGVEQVVHNAAQDPVSLRERIESILGSRGSWGEMRTKAAEFARREWNWDRCAAQYEEILKQP